MRGLHLPIDIDRHATGMATGVPTTFDCVRLVHGIIRFGVVEIADLVAQH